MEIETLQGLLGAEVEVFHLPRVDSTNTWLLERLVAGEARAPALVVAGEQERGRGRLGRRWHARAGRALILSLAPPRRHWGLEPQILAMASALSVRAGVRATCGVEAALKWPNDLLIGGRKVAGILVEARSGAAGPAALVIGIGVNVAEERGELPAELRESATSLAIEGSAVPSIEELAGAIAGDLLERLEHLGEAALAREYASALGLIGRAMRVRTARGEVIGVARSLDVSQGLELEVAGARQFLALAHISSLTVLESG